LQTRRPTRSSAAGRVWLLISAALAVLYIALAPPYSQPQDYHLFADRRSILGIPNFWNVVSNLRSQSSALWGCANSATPLHESCSLPLPLRRRYLLCDLP